MEDSEEPYGFNCRFLYFEINQLDHFAQLDSHCF